MIKAPNAYSPFRNPERTRERRDLVLRLMREERKIDEAALAQALRSSRSCPASRARRSAPTRRTSSTSSRASSPSRYGEKLQDRGPADLHDARRRSAAGRRSAPSRRDWRRSRRRYRRLAAAARRRRRSRARSSCSSRRPAPSRRSSAGATTVSRSSTGSRRRTGSPDRSSSRSSYLAAFARRDLDPPVTPATILEDSPITVEWGKAARGRAVDARATTTATTGARCRRAGRSSSRSTSRRCARRSPPDLPARARGGAGRGHQLAAARLSVGRSRGLRDLAAWRSRRPTRSSPTAACGSSPNAIVGVLTSDGRVLDRKETPLKPVLPADAVFLVDSILRGAVDRGTAAGARAGGLRGVLAGKTGTTNDGRDAWFVGFSPRFLAAVWVGYDDNRGLNLPGTQAAVPIFADFSRSVPAAALRRELSRALRHRDGGDRSRDRLPRHARLPAAHDRGLHLRHAPRSECPAHGLSGSAADGGRRRLRRLRSKRLGEPRV